MWPNYVVSDNFLQQKHFDIIKEIKFDTKPMSGISINIRFIKTIK